MAKNRQNQDQIREEFLAATRSDLEARIGELLDTYPLSNPELLELKEAQQALIRLTAFENGSLEVAMPVVRKPIRKKRPSAAQKLAKLREIPNPTKAQNYEMTRLEDLLSERLNVRADSRYVAQVKESEPTTAVKPKLTARQLHAIARTKSILEAKQAKRIESKPETS